MSNSYFKAIPIYSLFLKVFISHYLCGSIFILLVKYGTIMINALGFVLNVFSFENMLILLILQDRNN